MEDVVIDGRITLDKLIGSGGVANVYSAHDTNQEYAVKIYKKASTKLDKEYRLVTLLQKNNPVGQLFPTYYSMGEFEYEGQKYRYIVMEKLSGKSLSTIINEKRRNKEIFTKDEFNDIAYALLIITSYLHHKGLVHRDIKPENIIYDQGIRRLVLIDYDTACLTKVGTVATCKGVGGTPRYMAPETLQSNYVEELTKQNNLMSLRAADIWSVGVILWSIKTMKVAYNAPTVPAIFQLIRTTSLETDDPMIAEMLVQEPDKRPSATLLLKTYFDSKGF